MKSTGPIEQPVKGKATLCNKCANQFLHPKGHDEPCSAAKDATLSKVNGHGLALEQCTHYMQRTTKKEGGTQMVEKVEAPVAQPPTLVSLAGPASVDLNFHYSPDDGKTKHTLRLAMPVSEEDLDKVRQLTKQKGTWFVELGVEGVQAELPLDHTADQSEDAKADPTMAARVEEAAGQKAG